MGGGRSCSLRVTLVALDGSILERRVLTLVRGGGGSRVAGEGGSWVTCEALNPGKYLRNKRVISKKPMDDQITLKRA